MLPPLSKAGRMTWSQLIDQYAQSENQRERQIAQQLRAEKKQVAETNGEHEQEHDNDECCPLWIDGHCPEHGR